MTCFTCRQAPLAVSVVLRGDLQDEGHTPVPASAFLRQIVGAGAGVRIADGAYALGGNTPLDKMTRNDGGTCRREFPV